MRAIVLLSACLAIAVRARRKVQATREQSIINQDVSSELKTLATIALSMAGPRIQASVVNRNHVTPSAPNKYITNERSAVSVLPDRRTTPIMSSMVVKEDYKLAAVLAAVGLLVLVAPALVGAPLLLLGSFLLFQTFRIRFVFDEDAFEVKTKPLDELFSGEDTLTETGDNFAVGGDNRWKYDSFVNWEFFPSVDLPVLVYFKETQTPSDKWDVGPGQWANSADALAKGAVKGQVHFFPCIANAETLKENFIAKGCAKLK